MKMLSRMCGALVVLVGLTAGAMASPLSASGGSGLAPIADGAATHVQLASYHGRPPFAGPPAPPWAGPPWQHGRRWRSCDARGAGWAIGRRAHQRVVAEARRSARAQTVRVEHPGHFYTREYNPRRLTIQVNRRNRIVDVRCG